MENYERKYKKALERAKKLYEQGTITESLGFVFPELKESEDERIRKAIKKALQVRCGGSRIISDEPVTLEEAVVWLEKQGEHANFCNKIQIGDKVTRNEDGVLVNLSQVNRAAKPTNEEQKDILEDAILDGNEDGLIAETIRYKK
jgi:hypothetical protein